MLVLTRKTDEEFRFPQLGIRVHILASHGNRVRVGIDAPKEFKVTRGERPSELDEDDELTVIKTHDMKNQMNQVKLGLHLAEKLFAANQPHQAEQVLRDAIRKLTELELTTFTPAENYSAQDVSGKVLLVEDDANESNLLTSILELEGYDVLTARNGEEALQVLEIQQPDFVLLDMRMPIMGGRETIEQIRENDKTKSLPVYAVSATCPEQVGVPINGGEGVDGWFPKPLEPATMLNELRSHSHAETA